LKTTQFQAVSQRASNQTRSLQDKANRQEQLLNEFKEALYNLENADGLIQEDVTEAKKDLQERERELMAIRSDRSGPELSARQVQVVVPK
jgi:hypothetical protein